MERHFLIRHVTNECGVRASERRRIAAFNLRRIIHLSLAAITRTDLDLVVPVNLLLNFTVGSLTALCV